MLCNSSVTCSLIFMELLSKINILLEKRVFFTCTSPPLSTGKGHSLPKCQDTYKIVNELLRFSHIFWILFLSTVLIKILCHHHGSLFSYNLGTCFLCFADLRLPSSYSIKIHRKGLVFVFNGIQ